VARQPKKLLTNVLNLIGFSSNIYTNTPSFSLISQKKLNFFGQHWQKAGCEGLWKSCYGISQPIGNFQYKCFCVPLTAVTGKWQSECECEGNFRRPAGPDGWGHQWATRESGSSISNLHPQIFILQSPFSATFAIPIEHI